MSSYFLVSIQANYFRSATVKASQNQDKPETLNPPSKPSFLFPFSQHRCWESGTTWKSALNNLRLILQPYLFYCLIQPWLEVLNIPGMRRGFVRLINCMNQFRGWVNLSRFPDHSFHAIALDAPLEPIACLV